MVEATSKMNHTNPPNKQNRTEQNRTLTDKHLTCCLKSLFQPLQFLWEHIQEQTQPSGNFSIYNGGVEAVSSLMGG